MTDPKVGFVLLHVDVESRDCIPGRKWKTGSRKRRILPILYGFKVLDTSWLLDPDLG